MLKKYGLVLLKTWVQTVATHQFSVGSLVGLYPAFLPTIKVPVSKWVILYQFNPQVSNPFIPTHFLHFTPVIFHLSPLSTPPIMNRN